MNYTDIHREIVRIDFSIFGNEEIKKSSAMPRGILTYELYDNQEPQRDSVNDLRLGTTNDSRDCETCGLNYIHCPTHFGHLNLAAYMYHIGYLPIVQVVLSCICIRCSKLLLHKNEKDVENVLKIKSNKLRLNEVRNLSKHITVCMHENNNGCGAPVTKIKKETKKATGSISLCSYGDSKTSIGLNAEYTNNAEQTTEDKKQISDEISAFKAYIILKNISDLDCYIMGFDPKKSRPENMIHTVFPIPPIAVRPSVRAEYLSSNLKEDDLTHKLAEIIKANERVAHNNESDNPSKNEHEFLHCLQYQIASYFDSEAMSGPKTDQKTKTTKSLCPRIKGKEGRIRGNLMGKRVNFSGRTVISPDPTIEIDQIRIPVKIAMNLTFKEIVSHSNIEFLTKLVKNGRYIYPGANFVKLAKSDNSRYVSYDLRIVKEKIELKIGDVVERHMLNDDILLVNRQPSLHKLSMMAHRAKVINDPTLSSLGLSPSVVTPYNADFDGDEMNIFFPQSLQAVVELDEIVNIKKQIITPATSSAIIGVIQDSLIGSYLMTSDKVMIDRNNAMNILANTNYQDLHLFPKGTTFKGPNIYEYIIPEGINAVKGQDSNITVIENGKIIKGNVGKSLVGSSIKNGLTQIIWDECGVDKTKDFLNNVQKIAIAFNAYYGFTVGVKNALIDKKIIEDINKLYDTRDLKIAHLITEFENTPDKITSELLEHTIYSTYNGIRDEISKLVVGNMGTDNAMNIMLLSGSKGSPSNLGQNCGCIGLQAFDGKIMPKRMNHRGLPYFFRDDDSMSARGMCKSSFIKGMTMTEYYYQNIAARCGVITQVVGTADSGYIQRRLVKLLEDHMVAYDKTVRSSTNQIIQFTYGDSGAETTKQYDYNIKLLEMSDDEIMEEHILTDKEMDKTTNKTLYETLITLRNKLRLAQIKSRMSRIVMSSVFMIPVNLVRIIKYNKLKDGNDKTKLDPKYVFEQLELLLLNQNTPLYTMKYDNNDNTKVKDNIIIKTVFYAALLDALSPKKCIYKHKFTKKQFDNIVTEIKMNYRKNMIQAGEMIGIVAAQSLGEPTTQITIDSFHRSGIAVISDVISGVPRMNELTRLAVDIKTPQMVIYLTKEHRYNKSMAKKIGSFVQFTTIGHVRQKLDILYDPLPLSENGYMKIDNVPNKSFTTKINSRNGCQSDINMLPWLLRVELNKEKLYEKEVSLLDIKSKLCHFWEKRNNEKVVKGDDKQIVNNVTNIAILSNTDYDIVPVLHIRFDVVTFDISLINGFADLMVDNFALKGMPGISKISGPNAERIIDIDETTGALEKSEQYVIPTSGTNLIDIRYLNHIDIHKIVSNDVVDMYVNFGIEAARSVLLKEIILAYEGAGSSINYQHVAILVDMITFNGNLISIDRHGMNKTSIGPLSKASFEKQSDILLKAAAFSEVDMMKGVSARIMAGLVVNGGTGFCDVKLDHEFIQNSEYYELPRTHKSDIESNSVISSVVNNDINLDDNMFMP